MIKFLSIIVLLIPCELFCQSGVIRGRVADAGTHEPLAGASVAIEGSRLGGTTDARGLLFIRAVPPGVYTLKATFVGYQTAIKHSVRVKAGDTTRVEFLLHPETVQMNEYMAPVMPHGIPYSPTAANRVARAPQEPNTEEYARLDENEFLDARSNPLSTFSIDVDVASYTNVRRFIQSGTLPPPDAVRTEELINYFSYDYPPPADQDPFSITTELSGCPWSPRHNLLLIGLQGRKLPLENLPPSNLVFLIDVSGSMEDANKLPLVQASLRLLVQQLRPVDIVSIVVYAGQAGVVLPATHGDMKSKIIEAIDGLGAGGSTAGGEGILLAYRIAHDNLMPKGNNRIVWATDGDFNVGVSNTADLVRLVEEKRQEGVYLSLLGFGMGNLKDSRMEQLADKGNGNYAYIDNFTEARRVLVGQMAGTLFTIAKDVKIQIEFNPSLVQSYRLIGYENRLLSKEDFNNDRKDAGELGSGHSVTALYELAPPGAETGKPRSDTLKYQVSSLSQSAMTSHELMTVKLRYKPPSDTTSLLLMRTVQDSSLHADRASTDFRFVSAVAEFAMLLRDSPFKGNASFDALIGRAVQSLGRDPDGYRSEFIRLAGSAKELVASTKK